jgi:hypothetical protein
MRYAIISNGIVENVAVWDGIEPWDPGLPIVQLVDNEWCEIGCLYNESAAPRFYPAPAEE